MANETLIVEKYLSSLFAADTALSAIIADRAYNKVAPQMERRTCVIFAYLAGGDSNTVGCRGVAEMDYKIVASGELGKADIQTAADRIDALLQNLSAVSGGVTVRCKRQSIYSDESSDSGIQYEDIGGIYRFWV